MEHNHRQATSGRGGFQLALLGEEESDPFLIPPESGLRLGVTGHRLNKILKHNNRTLPVYPGSPESENPIEYERMVEGRLRGYAKLLLSDMWLRPDIVYTGMALGWDQAIANACIDLGIAFYAVIPFVGQERRWSLSQRKHYEYLLRQASNVTYVCDGTYAAWKYLKRDQWIVDHCSHLLCFWNGQPDGGTYKTVQMAERKKPKPLSIANAWQPWARLVYKDEARVPHQIQTHPIPAARQAHDQVAQAGQSSSATTRDWRFF